MGFGPSTLLSSRGRALILGGTELGAAGYPLYRTLTVENTTKWYSLFLVSVDGTVGEINPEEVIQNFDGTVWGDHVLNPEVAELLADMLGAYWDEVALDTVIGRWHREHTRRYP